MVFDTICTLPLPSDLFAQILHPTLPILSVGLSSGHVHTYRLPSADGDDDDGQQDESSPEPPSKKHKTSNNSGGVSGIISTRRRSSTASENGLGSIDTVWKTRRHKGSCRALAFSHDGELVYSAGTDGIVKAAVTETGTVVSKIAVPLLAKGEVDAPTVLHALSPMNLLLGTDSGRIYVHDMRQGGKEVVGKAANVFKPHDTEGEFLSSITPLPPSQASTSGFPKQWISTGGTTVAVTDLRKGVLKKSDPQEDELTCSTFVGGLKKGKTSVGEKVLVGQGSGVIGLWERGVWDDIDDRIVVDRNGNSVDCMTEVPVAVGGVKMGMNEKLVAVGLEDGRVRFVKIGSNKVLEELDVKHDEVDGVVALDFDNAGRMVSGGGQIIKVWTEAKGMPGGYRNGAAQTGAGSDHENDSDSDMASDSSDEEVSEKGKRKKRKRNKGKDKSGGQAITFKGLG